MLRRILLLVVGGAAAFLVPWTIYLGVTLPERFDTGAWRAAWVGFDIVLLCCFAAAAWLGLRRKRAAVSFMIATSALLCCDAWFDVMLDWGTPSMWTSLAMAVLIELPLAGLLTHQARVLLTGDMPTRTLDLEDVGLQTDPGYVLLKGALNTRGAATTAELADALSLPHHELREMLTRMARAGHAKRGRDGRWRAGSLDLRPPELGTLDEADRQRIQDFYDAKYEHEVKLLAWAAQHRDEFGSWGNGSRAGVHLTEPELARFGQEYLELVTRYCLLRSGPEPGTRNVAVRWYAFPAPGPEAVA